MSMPSSWNIKAPTCGGSVARLTAAGSAEPESPSDTQTSNASSSMSGPPHPNTVAAEPMASTGHSGEISSHHMNNTFPSTNLVSAALGAHDSFASVNGQGLAEALLSVVGSADGSMPMAAPTMSPMDINSTLSAIPTDLPIDMIAIDEDTYIAPASLMDDGIPRHIRSEQRRLVSSANDPFMGSVGQSARVPDPAQGFMSTLANVPSEGLEQAPQVPVPELGGFMPMDYEATQGPPTFHTGLLYPVLLDQDWIRSSASYNTDWSLDTAPILSSQGSDLLGGAPTPEYSCPHGLQCIEPTHANTAMNARLQTSMLSAYPASFVPSPAASTVCPADIMLRLFNSAGLDSEAMGGSTVRSMTHGIANGSTYGASIDEMSGDINGEEFNGDREGLDDEEETDGDYHEDDDDDEDSNGPDYGGTAATWKGKARKDEPRSCSQYTDAEYLGTFAKDLHINDRFDRCYDPGSHTFATHSSAGVSSSSDSSASRFPCPVPGCTLDFSTKWNINDHIERQHSDAKKFKCNRVGCKMEFNVRRDMMRHINEFHEHRKPHMCPKCNMSFKRRYKMTEHFKKKHSGEPLPFKKPSKECDE